MVVTFHKELKVKSKRISTGDNNVITTYIINTQIPHTRLCLRQLPTI